MRHGERKTGERRCAQRNRRRLDRARARSQTVARVCGTAHRCCLRPARGCPRRVIRGKDVPHASAAHFRWRRARAGHLFPGRQRNCRWRRQRRVVCRTEFRLLDVGCLHGTVRGAQGIRRFPGDGCLGLFDGTAMPRHASQRRMASQRYLGLRKRQPPRDLGRRALPSHR